MDAHQTFLAWANSPVSDIRTPAFDAAWDAIKDAPMPLAVLPDPSPHGYAGHDKVQTHDADPTNLI